MMMDDRIDGWLRNNNALAAVEMGRDDERKDTGRGRGSLFETRNRTVRTGRF